MDSYDIKYAQKALFVLAPIAIIVMYTEAMLTPSLPDIANQFNVSVSDVSWVLTAYFMAGVVANPIMGKLGDIYGKKKILTYIMIIYTIAVTLNGFAPSFSVFIAFRVLQGLGLSMFPLSFSLIREEFPPHLVPRAQGIVSAMFGVGSAISLPIAAYIAQNLGWEYNYHIIVPFVVLLTYLVFKEIRESRYTNPNVKIDYLGLTLLSSALALMTLSISKAPDWSWTSFNFITTMIVGLILFSSFVIYETRTPNPLLPIKTLTSRNVFAANLAAFVAGFAIFMPFQALTFLFELPNPVGFNMTILQTGILMLPISFGQMIGALSSARIISRYGTKSVLIIASIMLSGFDFLIGNVVINGSSGSLGVIIGLVLIVMIASAMLNVTLINILTFSIDRKMLGIMTGMNTVFRLIGGSFGPAVAGSILSTYYTFIINPLIINGKIMYIPVKLPSDYGFYMTFLIASIIALIMTGIALITNNIRISGTRIISEDKNIYQKSESIPDGKL